MGRLTTEKGVKDMSMYELALNSCYAKDRKARYRDYETDIDARDLARNLMVAYGVWKGMQEYGLDANNELVDDDIFDESILDSLQYGTDTIEGLIALFYRNLWAMADLRTRLKRYEDLEEQGRLVELPCAVGDTVYRAILGEVYEYTVGSFLVDENGAWGMSLLFKQEEKNFAANMDCDNLGKTVFLTKEEAEAKLAELKGETT